MTYPTKIRLFYSANLRAELVGPDKSLSGIVRPISSKPKTLLEIVDGKNLYFTPHVLGRYPVQLEVSHIYGRKHTGPGVKVDEVDGFDALYVLSKRYKRQDGSIAEAFYLESFAEDRDRKWNRLSEGIDDFGVIEINGILHAYPIPLEAAYEASDRKWYAAQTE